MGIHFGGLGYNGINPSFWANNAGTISGFTFNAAIVSTSTPATAPAACVRVDARVRYTRTISPTTATVATLDAACTSAFGASYQTADIRDLGSLWRANVGLNLQPRFIATNRGATPLVGVFAEGGNNPVSLSQFFVTGTYQVACVRLTP
ncbi:Hypothetical protein A7982_00217 [Minicystis rosea]|nr:Hypothetical protein A7982_00217 [Minicystis rosea]